jgi:hypothetical protein
MPRVIALPEPEPEPAAAGADVVAEFAVVEPGVLDVLQAATTPDRRVAAAAVASNRLLFGIFIEDLPIGYLAINYLSR